jgi:hypothetical protein
MTIRNAGAGWGAAAIAALRTHFRTSSEGSFGGDGDVGQYSLWDELADGQYGVTDPDEDDTYKPRLSTGPTRPTSKVLDEILDDDSLDESSDRHEKHRSKRPLTQDGIESKRRRRDSELELGAETLAAPELPSRPAHIPPESHSQLQVKKGCIPGMPE